MLLLVTTSIQTACISLEPSRVPRYQAFHTTALSELLFNLPLTESSSPRFQNHSSLWLIEYISF